MKGVKEPASLAVVIFALAVIAVTGMIGIFDRKAEQQDMRPHVRSIVNMGKYDPHSQKLLAGYNYFLLQQIAEDSGTRIDIRLSDEREYSLDSLMDGNADILVLPFDDSTDFDSSLIRLPVDSAGLWLLAPDMEVEARIIEDWMESFRKRDDYTVVRQPFFSLYDPYRRISADYISPYDEIVKSYADTLGWDWKLLSALIWKESNFRIEARSHRGAQGLMQMMPSTAERFEVEDIINPEHGIRAGVKYLMRLSHRYRGIDEGEREKFVLAAYNAGEGRIRDCMNYARYRGVNEKVWDSLITVIPEMNDSTVAGLDTVSLGAFRGTETIDYVASILDIYERYRKICQ